MSDTYENRRPPGPPIAETPAMTHIKVLEAALAVAGAEIATLRATLAEADARLAGVEAERDAARVGLAASKWCAKHSVAQPCQFCPDARIVARLGEETTLRSNMQQEVTTLRESLAACQAFGDEAVRQRDETAVRLAAVAALETAWRREAARLHNNHTTIDGVWGAEPSDQRAKGHAFALLGAADALYAALAKAPMPRTDPR
jgi:hypothetical protein